MSNMKKSVFITGGSRGIGEACVRKFHKEGWNVAFTYEKENEKANILLDELLKNEEDSGCYEGEGSSLIALQMDLRTPASIKNAVEEAKAKLGIDAFDGAVLNAGGWIGGLIQDMSDKDINELVSVNLTGQMILARELTPGMISERRGSIVLVSSMWGITGASCESVYSATKSGLIGFGKSLAAELGPSNVRVNVVAPGVIDTDMNKGYSAEEMEVLREAAPLGRIGEPTEVAEGIYFLTSDASGFITGQVLGIDGGITL